MKSRAFAAGVLSFLVLAGGGLPRAFAGEQGQTETVCAAYRSDLLKARASLARGDRAEAIAALRRALASVDGCLEAGNESARLASGGRDLKD
jgi:hypothetical protein